MKALPGFSRKLLLTGTLAFIYMCSWGQEADPSVSNLEQANYDIRWVSQYPATKEKKSSGKKEKKTRRNTNWFTDLVFGKKPASLIKPMSIVALSPDAYWVADQGTGSILKVHNKQGETKQFKEMPIESLPSIVGSCFTSSGSILFTDSKLNQIFLMVPGSKNLQILNDSVHLEQPTGIAYSAVTNQVWVVETKAHRIAILNEQGEIIKHIGGRGNADGKFNFPTYIWIDEEGTAYVVDAMNFRVQIFDTEGEFISSFGEIGDSSGYFSRPKGIATDSFGHIYVSDALFNVIQVFDRAGQLLYTFGSQGQEKEQFWMPTGIYIDKDNFIYIADSYNSRIQVFQLIPGD